MAVFICQSCGNEHASWDGKCPNCGHTELIKLNAATDAMLEKTIKGKYKIVRKLGQGGMGAVYLAEQVGIGHRVALKFLKSEFSTDVEIARRFMNEAKSYARVAHPNAVVFHDFGQDDDGNLFIAMEYCEGIGLKKVISDAKRMPLPEVMDVVLQVADVLANAHTKGVIHRDLKPENIMLRKGMRGVHAKVLDFGIARLMGEGTRLTMQGSIAGTPRYMSPEQVEGKEVDLRADVYALGILTFECLTGVQPFDGHTITEILRKQVSAPMPHLKDISSDLDFPAVDAVIQKAVAKRREDRWPDMLAFASALSQATPTLAGNAFSGLPSASDHEASQHTFLRQDTKSMPVRAAAPVASEARTQLATPAPSSLLSTTLEGSRAPSDSSIVAPRKSMLPLVAVAAAGLAALGVGAWVLLPVRSNLVVPPPPIEAARVVKPVEPPVPVNVPSTVGAPAEPSERDIDHARDFFSRGSNAWERGNIEEAQVHFRDVPAATSFRADADAFLKKIDTIHAYLKIGQSKCGASDFEGGLNALSVAFKLNPAVETVRAAQRACNQAKPPGQLE